MRFDNKNVILPAPIEYKGLKFTSTGNSTIKLPQNVDLKYSFNGYQWTQNVPGQVLSVGNNQSIYVKGLNLGTFTTYSNRTTNRFTMTGSFEVSGNIMSLFDDGDGSSLMEIPTGGSGNRGLYTLFENCTALTSAENLLLPATILKPYCYAGLFNKCSNLLKAPKVLPALTLPSDAYQAMFASCGSLTASPDIMATSASARFCLAQTFQNCSNLNYIKCMAVGSVRSTDFSQNVAANGTFVKNANMSSWPSGKDGIPTGWTVIDA